MRDPNSAFAPSVEELEEAFQTLVDSLVLHRRKWKRPPLKSDLALHGFVPYDEALLPQRGSVSFTDVVADPVSWAIKRGVTAFAQAIYDKHGMETLRGMAERVCDAGPGDFPQRMSPVDSALNGVGKGKDRWWS